MSDQQWTDHPRLWAWLREREEAFPQWAADHPGDWDFSPESVNRLQGALEAEFSSCEKISAARRTPAVTVPAWYLGQVCVRLGAVWKHTYASPIDTEDWPGPIVGAPGDPMENQGFVMPAGEDHLHPVMNPTTAVCDVLWDLPECRLSNVVAEFDTWRRAMTGESVTYAEKLRDNPRLHAWMQEQEEGFPQWAAAHPGVWDFSPESVDRLQTTLKTEFSSDEEIEAAKYTPSVTVPAWYFGEVCVRAGAVWKHHPDYEPDPGDPDAWPGPFLGVPGDPTDDPDYEDPYDDYVPSAHPVYELCSMFAKSPEWQLHSIVERFEKWRRETADDT